MKLSQAKRDQVVRNVRNGSHYRMERMERGKVRIYSLELFPTGLLIPKPTPTVVEPDLEVVLIGPYVEGMTVEGKPTKSRKVYEKELLARERELAELRVTYEELPRSGVGALSRGSWANKVKAAETRVRTLKTGLGFVPSSSQQAVAIVDEEPRFSRGQKVQVPSGRLGLVMGLQPMGDTIYASVKTVFQGATVEASLPCEVLRDAQQSRLCTI